MTNKIQFEDFKPNMDMEQYCAMHNAFVEQEDAEVKVLMQQLATKLGWPWEAVDNKCIFGTMNMVLEITIECSGRFPPCADGSMGLGSNSRHYLATIALHENEITIYPKRDVEEVIVEIQKHLADQANLYGILTKEIIWSNNFLSKGLLNLKEENNE